MQNVIVFERTPDGVTLTVDGTRVGPAPSLAIRNHSPSGFEYGYAGSGPAQSALAILLHVLGRRNAEEDGGGIWGWPGGDAERLYQDFKFEFIAGLPHTDKHVELRVNVEQWADDKLAERTAA